MARENALFLENTCRNALNYQDRGALNGLIDADEINRVGGAYNVLAATLAPYFKDGDSAQRELINNYLAEYYSLSDNDLNYEEYDRILGHAHASLRELLNTINR